MTRQVRCECGYTARGETDAAVIAQVLAHVAVDHPDLAGSETADDVNGPRSSYSQTDPAAMTRARASSRASTERAAAVQDAHTKLLA